MSLLAAVKIHRFPVAKGRHPCLAKVSPSPADAAASGSPHHPGSLLRMPPGSCLCSGALCAHAPSSGALFDRLLLSPGVQEAAAQVARPLLDRGHRRKYGSCNEVAGFVAGLHAREGAAPSFFFYLVTDLEKLKLKLSTLTLLRYIPGIIHITHIIRVKRQFSPSLPSQKRTRLLLPLAREHAGQIRPD